MNDTWKAPNPYTLDWHTEACKAYAEGKPNPPITDEPITGYFRASMRKDGQFIPVRYFYERNGEAATGYDLWCELNCGRTDEDYYWNNEKLPNGQTVRQFWPYASKHPIPKEQYTFYQENDRWQEISEAVHLSNNPPPDIHPDSLKALEHAINPLLEDTKRLLANKPAKNQTEEDEATVLIGKLSEFADEDKKMRAWLQDFLKTEPSISPEVRKAVELYQSLWARGLNLLQACEAGRKSVKQEFQKPFLIDLKAKSGGELPVQKAVMGYRATTLVPQKKARIDNYSVLIALCGAEKEVWDAVQKWANAYVRKHKEAPPGCEVVEEDIAS